MEESYPWPIILWVLKGMMMMTSKGTFPLKVICTLNIRTVGNSDYLYTIVVNGLRNLLGQSINAKEI